MHTLLSLICSATLLLSIAPISAYANTQEQPPWIEFHEWNMLPDQLKIESRELELRGQVDSYLAERGYRLGSGASGDFQRAIERAALEIQSFPPDLQRTRMEYAVASFRLVIDTMIIESRRIPGYQSSHFRVIGEQTFAEAMQKLCPVWPFCK